MLTVVQFLDEVNFIYVEVHDTNEFTCYTLEWTNDLDKVSNC